MPCIKLEQEIYDDEAYRLQSYFAKGVISVTKNKKGQVVAKVADSRRDTCNRQVLEDQDLCQKVDCSKIRDHFLFSVESVSYLRSDELVIEALNVLTAKCDVIINFLDN